MKKFVVVPLALIAIGLASCGTINDVHSRPLNPAGTGTAIQVPVARPSAPTTLNAPLITGLPTAMTTPTRVVPSVHPTGTAP
jgi:hypothetical protein